MFKMALRRFYLLIWLQIFLFSLSAEDFPYRTIGCMQGLSQSSAISIWQDDLGRMWFGNDALNCFNGESVKVYRLSEFFSGVEDGNLHDICGKNNQMYFLLEDRLFSFNLTAEKFTMTNIRTNSICCMGEKLCYVDKKGNLCQYIKETKISSVVCYLPSKITTTAPSLLMIDNERILVGTSEGLYLVNVKSKRIISHILLDEEISCLFYDSSGHVWIGCSSRSVYIYSLDRNGAFSLLPSLSPFKKTEGSPLCMAEDSQGKIWIGTMYGVYKIQAAEFGYEFKMEHFLPQSSIYALYSDKQGTLWLGSYYGDVRYFNPERDNFLYYPTDENISNALHGSVVGTIVEDKRGNTYIATQGSGINVLKSGSNIFQHITAESNQLANNKVRTLWYDEAGDRVFISLYMKGLCFLDLKDNRIHSVHDEVLKTISQRIIEKIVPYNDVLILLTQNGLFSLNRNTLVVEPLFNDPKLRLLTGDINRTIFIDDRNVLWISSARYGLMTIDMRSRRFIRNYGNGTNSKSVVPSGILDICGNTQSGLYLATLRSGVLSYIASQDTFIRFTHDKWQLLSDICYHVVVAPSGKLIVTSNQGLSLLDIVHGGKDVSSVYHIQLRSSFPLAAMVGDCGLLVSKRQDKIFIGGLNGLAVMSEKNLNNENNNYSLYLSSLSVNGKVIKPASSILEKSFSETESITLPHYQNSISITFASSDYQAPFNTIYAYKLEGLDQLWTSTIHKTITYNSLRPGHYKLLIKEELNPDKIVRLNIIVRPSLWMSWYAWIVYFILFTLALYCLYRFSKSKTALLVSLEKQRKEVAKAEESNQLQFNLFTNIANEFRTPLTLIITILERLSHSITVESKNKVEIVRTQVIRLQQLISELSDIRKMEYKHLMLNVSRHNIVDFIQKMSLSYSEYANEHNIRLTITPPSEQIFLWFDVQKMQNVFYNLFTTIFYIVEEKGDVVVSFQKKGSYENVFIRCSCEKLNVVILQKLLDNFGEDKASESVDEIGFLFTKGIMELHKGLITAEKDGIGAIIKVSLLLGKNHFPDNVLHESEHLPIVENAFIPSLSRESKIVSPELVTEAENDLEDRKYKMLLIENDDDVRILLKESFSLIYDVTDMTDGNLGYSFALKEVPDIVICSVNVSGLSGIELCNILKSNLKTSFIPIVLTTAQPSIAQQTDSYRSGADSYVVKPFDMEMLFLRCNSLVKNYKNIVRHFLAEEENMVDMTTNAQDKEFLSSSNRIIEDNYGNTDFNIEDWSHAMNIGRTRLFNRIKEITGMTPNDYILKKKMEQSARLLSVPEDITVSEVAYRLGFSNPAYFTRCFKKQFGVTPQEYRRHKISRKISLED